MRSRITRLSRRTRLVIVAAAAIIIAASMSALAEAAPRKLSYYDFRRGVFALAGQVRGLRRVDQYCRRSGWRCSRWAISTE